MFGLTIARHTGPKSRRCLLRQRRAAGYLGVVILAGETAREIRELRRKNAELERTIEVLKAAASFFARECDPLHR
jgi:transposase-like protein